MSDQTYIDTLLGLASDALSLRDAQLTAAKRLLEFDGEIYPSDGCAITLSVLLQRAGITVADTFTAIELGSTLKKRGWQRIDVGQQLRGDIGSTCGQLPHHGADHIYLVLRRVNDDEMIIADNQAHCPHARWASGVPGGKTATRFFLRAL